MSRTIVLLCLLLCAGCGSGVPKPVRVTGTPIPEPSAKEILAEIVKTGELSGETHIEEEIEKIRATDPNKAADLHRDYNVLSRLDEPDAIKHQANKMLAKFK